MLGRALVLASALAVAVSAAAQAVAPAPAAKSTDAAKKMPAPPQFKLVLELRAMELLNAAQLPTVKSMSFTATVNHEA